MAESLLLRQWLSVCSGDVDREEVPLGVSDVSAECGDTLQSRFVSRGALGFEGGQRLEEEFESLVIVHDSKGFISRDGSFV